MKGVIDRIIEYTAYAILALSVLAVCILSVVAISEEETMFFIIAASQFAGCFIMSILMLGLSALIENSNDISFYLMNITTLNDYEVDENKTNDENKNADNNKGKTEDISENTTHNQIDLNIESNFEKVEDHLGNIAIAKKQDIEIAYEGISFSVVDLNLEYEIIKESNSVFEPLLSWYNADGEKIKDVRLKADIKNNIVKINKRMELRNNYQKIDKIIIGK